MNWNRMIYERLISSPNVTDLVPVESIYASLDGIPANRPFIILRFGEEPRDEIRSVTARDLEVGVHDNPGDYQLINDILEEVSLALESYVAPGVIAIAWQGNSSELPDEGLNSITRHGSFRLLGKVQEALA